MLAEALQGAAISRPLPPPRQQLQEALRTALASAQGHGGGKEAAGGLGLNLQEPLLMLTVFLLQQQQQQQHRNHRLLHPWQTSCYWTLVMISQERPLRPVLVLALL